MIERQIIIGLITSTQYIQRIRKKWNVQLFESVTAKRIAMWCIEYFDKYNKAPNRDIEGIFYEKIKAPNFPEEIAEEIEQDILPDLSSEYENEGFNVDYAVDETNKYFTERSILHHSAELKSLIDSRKLLEAEKLALSFQAIPADTNAWIDLSSQEVLERIDRAFDESTDPLIRFPGELGKFIDEHLCRGKFLAFMASEKRGKTFWLLEVAMRASKKGLRVGFFQAGDMTESEQLKRIAIYLARKSDKKKYCGKMFEPVVDCVLNQTHQCTRDERTCSFGIFNDKTIDEALRIPAKELKEVYENEPEYTVCTGCEDFTKNSWATVWLKEVEVDSHLTKQEAKDVVQDFFIRYKRQFKLSSHANGTLSVSEIKSILDIWERRDNFIPDVIVIDYADILIDESVKEYRHKQNKIWMDLRGLSQSRHCLLITATQADADSYETDLLRPKNFSEDKRKYGHVTAMYGLNQDKTGREKALGIMRINELAMRDGDFHYTNQVAVLCNLRRGRPFLGSYRM